VRPRGLLAFVLAACLAGAAVALVVRHHGRGELQSLLRLGRPIYCGGGKGPYVALTFDDGPTRWTPQLLAILRRNGARATFFEIGQHAAARPDLVRREAQAGAVGDHTWSHRPLTQLGRTAVSFELGKAKDTIESAAGAGVVLFRPPFGAGDAVVDRAARRLGLLEILWNVDSGDASGASTLPSAEIARNLRDRVRAGSIVLLHEDQTVPRTVDAMRSFLPELRRRGLRAVTVPELLRLDPPVRAQIPKGSGGCNSTWHQ
jgi:peptidoglycan/xylan/chitin deacetylase (PgdA/CDA1 family)